jgi:hypothetical protein
MTLCVCQVIYDAHYNFEFQNLNFGFVSDWSETDASPDIRLPAGRQGFRIFEIDHGKAQTYRFNLGWDLKGSGD